MKVFKAWVAITLLWAGGLALADPPAQVGRLNYLSGTISFAPAEANNDWGVAPLNRPVTTGDRLWSDHDGRAEIRIGSTAIRVGALTSIDVLRLDDDGVQLRLAQGTLHVHLRQLEAGDSFEVSTPSGAVLLTQPGIYRMSVDPAGASTSVLVRRGQADVLTGNAPFSLRDHQLANFSAQGLETFAAPPPDEFENWAAARDRQEERLVSTRYVPQAMTGYEDLDHHGTWQTTPQYGAIWMPNAVAAGWAPYRDGRWVWVSPWGWTWVDSAPWGFAPYHYGRWVWLGHRWAWAPGARVARPVYAPALVAFVGGANWSVSVSGGPAVGWVPLGWREPYVPWYRHSPAYVRNVNITHVTNINVIQQYGNINNISRIRYVNRDVPSATTVVSRDTFVSARRVYDAQLHVPAHALSGARVTHGAPVIRPERNSMVSARPGTRLPDAIASREVMAARAPGAPARFAREAGTGYDSAASREDHPRVRVLSTQRPAATSIPQGAPAAPVPVPQPAVRTERNDRAAERSLTAVPERPKSEPPPQIAPRANTMPAHPQAEAVRPRTQPLPQPASPSPQQRQLQQEQQQQARAQAQLAQQQKLQEQKERQHQAVQQRAHEVQLQRERQFQQAQQVQQQQQLRQQQLREQRQAERAAQQRQANTPRPPQAPTPANKDRRTQDSERNLQHR